MYRGGDAAGETATELFNQLKAEKMLGWSLVKRWLDHRKIRRVWRAWSVKKKEILKNAHESVWFRIVWCISYNSLFVQWLQGIGSIAKSSILDKRIRLKYKLCCRSHLFCIRFVFPSELSKSQSDVPWASLSVFRFAFGGVRFWYSSRKADVVTFNIMLRSLLCAGKRDEVGLIVSV